ncbi:TonB-dependent receptor [bacterium]|nr:TonB-dependent receptor [bacterium]
MNHARSVWSVLATLLLLVMLAGVVQAAPGKIVGTVVGTESSEPLIGVNIIIDGTRHGAATDLDGRYVILNVPPGTYEIKASIIGYRPVSVREVRVTEGRTTTIDIEMTPEALIGEEVVFVAEKPLIQPDMTDSRTTRTSEDIKAMPVENVREVIRLTPGAVGGNFRGGREEEVLYLVDGASMVDPMTGDYEGYIPQVAFEEVNVTTGGMSAQYGNNLSGVVSQITKEGGERYSGSFLGRTNDGGIEDDEMKDLQFALSGPIPLLDNRIGDLNFFVAGQWYDTRGRFVNDDSTMTSGFGKLSYSPTPKQKFTLSGNVTNSNWTNYTHLWSRTDYEDRLDGYAPSYNDDGTIASDYVYYDPSNSPWFNNGQLDTEDLNGNGVLDAGEDLDGDGVIDSEDLNKDGSLSNFSMLDHLPYFEQHINQFSAKWDQTISERTYFELGFSYFKTEMHYNTREYINEDANGNGQLDLEQAYSSIEEIPDDLLNEYRDVLESNADGTQYWFDYNQNGVWEYEDINGNEIWDWEEYGPTHDLMTDEDDDGYVDASQSGPRDTWLGWEDMPFGNSKDDNDFYTYGTGTTYNRSRWNNDSKETYTFKGHITSQMHQFHEVKAGFELTFYELFDHDVDMASGGNVYGQNFTASPRLYGAFVEDKMEFEGMVLNLGLRADYFDVNWDDYPSDITNPVTDPSLGGEVADPTAVEGKTYWGPRLGVAFPITERDQLSFNYSRNFQVPLLRYAFTNVNWDFSGAFPIVGNPNLEPERTTSYELTLRHQFTDDVVFVATGFYKDISGLVDTRQVFFTARNWYGLYINQDYGNVRGFEMSLSKRFSNFTSGSLSYTYAVAKGKASEARQNYENAWAGNLIRTTESYLDWDQRHTIYGNVQFFVPTDSDIFGLPYFDGLSINLIGKYGSGLPYSSPARSLDPPINDQRLPYTLTFDARVQKEWGIWKSLNVYAFVQVYNLLDRENIDQRFFQANADTGWYEQFNDVDGKYDDPRYYQRGRMLQVGAGIEF